MTTFTIKKGDTLPILAVVLKDGAGTPVDVSTASAKTFRMRKADASAHVRTVDRACAFTTDGSNGAVQIALTADETAIPGDYFGEFAITIGSDIQTFPSDSYIAIKVVDALA
jgi:hypothetical protein